MNQKTEPAKQLTIKTTFGKDLDVYVHAKDLVKCLRDESKRAILPDQLGGCPGTLIQKRAVAAAFNAIATNIEVLNKRSIHQTASLN